MISTLLLYSLILLLCLALSAFFSGSETATISVNKLRLRHLQQTGDQRAREVIQLLGDTRRVIGTAVVGNTIAVVFATLCFKEILEWVIPSGWKGMPRPFELEELIGLAILTPVIFLFCDILPKYVFRMKADTVIFGISKPLRFFSFVLNPILEVVNRVSVAILFVFGVRARAGGRRGYTREELESLFGTHETSPRALPSERTMVRSIIRLEKTKVREVMRPLIDLVTVRLPDSTYESVKTLARRTGFTRYPVYKDKVINLIGYLDIFDVITHEDSGRTLEDLVQEANYVPESKRLDDLLQEFLQRRNRVAIVVDEYGSCCGWVTREDLLEEIVGELEDEFEAQPQLVVPEADGSTLVDAIVNIDDLNDSVPIRLPRDDYETLGGFIYSELGRIPTVGDQVFHGDWV
ncbi:MAG: hemolysin family protein, partial [bacterium]